MSVSAAAEGSDSLDKEVHLTSPYPPLHHQLEIYH